MRTFTVSYEELVSIDNLLEAWQEFVKGKRNRKDVQLFERYLMQNLFTLHESLASMAYKHSHYTAFTVSDPKTRHIHKATVTDRVLHRAIYRKLYPFFDPMFISDAYSCRLNKGSHRALSRFTFQARQVSYNYRKTAWVLKCDIKKFFASIDQGILLDLIDPYVQDERITLLLAEIVHSFSSDDSPGIGLPLGNLTSQLFSNIYMNDFDRFVKHSLRVKKYIRYADDFVFLSASRASLENLVPSITQFLQNNLRLRLHPKKIELKTVASGMDYLGWVHFPHHRVLRTVTKHRMLVSLRHSVSAGRLASYKGLLKHGNAFTLSSSINHNP